jgi:hypothetical protein
MPSRPTPPEMISDRSTVVPFRNRCSGQASKSGDALCAAGPDEEKRHCHEHGEGRIQESGRADEIWG